MKKLFMITFSLILIYCNVNAQLKMNAAGSVSIATTPAPSSNIKLRVDLSDQTYSNYVIVAVNTPPTGQGRFNYGIYGSSYFSTAQTNSQNYGVLGEAGNATTGFNYGVYGRLLTGTVNGAGVFGAMRYRYPMDTQGNWAGFFNGDVKMTDNLWVTGTIHQSDQRLKKDITPLANNTFNKISQLNAVEYKYKTKQELKAAGIIPADTSTTAETENIFINKTHFGFIAQDVQQTLPDLVYEGADGILGIDYIGFIPLIIETIKQQNTKIDDLEAQLKDCCKSSTNEQKVKKMDNSTGQGSNETTISVELASINNIILYQNEPNPFDGSTVIRYFIPENMQIEAYMVFYDSYGNEIKKVEVKETGAGKIEANAQNLAAGIYSYSLVVNGKVVDTKKMMKNK